jgi:hypothetical protein
MMETADRHPMELGTQPLQQLMSARGLKAHDIVVAANGPMTHKAVSRACKGRRLTPRMQAKVLDAVSRACGEPLPMSALFNYGLPRVKDALPVTE